MKFKHSIFETNVIQILDNLSTSKLNIKYSYPLRFLYKKLIEFNEIHVDMRKSIISQHSEIENNTTIIKSIEGKQEYTNLINQQFEIDFNTINVDLNYLIEKDIELSIIELEILEHFNILNIIKND